MNDVRLKYLITGASGFIGLAVFQHFLKQGMPCIGIGRKKLSLNNYHSCDLLDVGRLESLLEGVSCIIHCAGYAHSFNNLSAKNNQLMWQQNYQATKNLGNLAVKLGVKKFINLSTVKVMSDPGNYCANEDWPLNPTTNYGKSKLAAEKYLFSIAKTKNIKIVNLRLVMVYGKCCGGNLERMANLIEKKIFPPLPDTKNHRSIIHIDDVVRIISFVIEDSRADGETFIVSGPDSPSGRKIYDEIRRHFGFRYLRFQTPRLVLHSIATIMDTIQRVTGIGLPYNIEVYNRLLESAWYSNKKADDLLNWRPKVGLKEGLQEMLGESQ